MSDKDFNGKKQIAINLGETGTGKSVDMKKRSRRL